MLRIFDADVMQEPFLFSTTVLENVLHGLPQERLAALSDVEKLDLVAAACKLANAHDFVQLLPNVMPRHSFL